MFMTSKNNFSRWGLGLLCTASLFMLASNRYINHLGEKQKIEQENEMNIRRIKLEKERLKIYFVKPHNIKNIKNSSEADLLEKIIDDNNLTLENSVKRYERLINRSSFEEIINVVKTPLEARLLILAYLKRNTFPKNNEFYSFKEIHEKKIELSCLSAAYVAATTLHDNGFPPLILSVAIPLEEAMKKDAPTHAVFLYKYNDHFGFVSNRCIKPPIFKNVSAVIDCISELSGRKHTRYRIRDLSEASSNWIAQVPDLSKSPYYEEVGLDTK